MIRIGVIGCGYWGPNLIRNFAEVNDCRVTMVSDLKVGRLNYIKTRYPEIKLTSNYRDILNNPEIDAVCIVTPVSTHFRITHEAMQAGKHVFVEKPLANSVEHAEILSQKNREKDLVLMVGHIFEYHPAVIRLKEMVDNGDIGDIFYIDSCRINLGPPSSELNVLWDLGPHDVSIILKLIGTFPEEVSAFGRAYIRPKLEEMIYITLKFPGKVVANIHLSWLAPCKLRRTQIVGSKKVVIFDDTDNLSKLKVFSEGIDTRIDATDFGEFQLTYRSGDIVCPSLDNIEPLKAEVSHFLECIRTKSTPDTDVENGLRVVKILQAADESMRNNGKPVSLK